MNRTLTLLGASAILLGVISGAAEARKVYYEIEGKRYSYSTNNRAQTSLARKRIQAAKEAEAAKAKADEERQKNPLVGLFGSEVQREATQAQARLKDLMGEKTKVVEERPSRSERRAARAERRKSRDEGRKAVAAKQEPKQEPKQAVAQAKKPPQPEPELAEAETAIAEPIDVSDRAKKVKSISFDVESGIKTTIMIDGSVEEEPFDSGVLSQLAPANGETTSLTAFVNQLRALPAVEATGSIGTKVATPAP
ncbi:hypothetical protein [Microvirga roseola]|uniref:hypothetical protein n=1 Tax=Microvirga roseola TaxID=2883126 RepID=UPI001E3D48B1|nr:hypothetical protein [Microvirga roseola]